MDNLSVVKKPVSLRPVAEAIDEVERELSVRARCYDKWVAEGKLSRSEATDRFARLVAAATHLKAHALALEAEAAQCAPDTIVVPLDKTA